MVSPLHVYFEKDSSWDKREKLIWVELVLYSDKINFHFKVNPPIIK